MPFMNWKRFPLHGYIGLGLVVVVWPLNWGLPGLRTHILFFPLWLGYCLVIDAVTCLRRGSSMITLWPARWVSLFLLSAPVWWLFELINLRTRNWIYLGRDQFTDIEYFFWASVCFSTVIPAVFGTAELISTFAWTDRALHAKPLRLKRRWMPWFWIGGLVMLALLLAFPVVFYPFVWLALFFLLDPIQAYRGRESLIAQVSRGNWKSVLTLSIGCLVCGFFWEMWNMFSYPKWIYQIPFFGFGRIFEMPILGYLGYIPFSWELFAVYHLVTDARFNPE